LFWVIFAAVIWLFIIIFLRSSLGKFWSAGFWAIVVGYLLNDLFIKNEFYLFNKILYPIQEIPAAYFICLAGIGVILASFLPQEKTWQLPYLILLSIIFSGLELFAERQGYLTYIHWTLYYSFLYKLFAFIAIAWLSNLTVKRRKNSYFFDRGAF
jgi:hypothetical protein